MKRKERMQLHTMSTGDLTSQIRVAGEQIKKMNMERFTTSAKNVHEITQLKRKLAIIKTMVQKKHQGEPI